MYYLNKILFPQTVSQLKVCMHILIGVLLGLFYEQAGSDASKTFSNLSFMLVSTVYLSYTSLMPAVLKSKFAIFLFHFLLHSLLVFTVPSFVLNILFTVFDTITEFYVFYQEENILRVKLTKNFLVFLLIPSNQ